MLEPDRETMRRLRDDDPRGRMANSDIERAARCVALHAAIDDLLPSRLLKILETIAALR